MTAAQRVPPHNIEAEEALLACAMSAPDAAESFVAEVEPADFYRPLHAATAAAIVRLVEGGELSCDPIAVAAESKRLGEDVGVADLLDMIARTPSTRRLGQYAAIVRSDAAARRRLVLAGEIVNREYAGEPTDKLVAELAAFDERAPGVEFEDVAAAFDHDSDNEPTLFVRSDGRRLIYPGKVGGFVGESTVGKTLLALMVAAQVLADGGTVVMLDYEDVLPTAVDRLTALGIGRTPLLERFRYLRPDPLDAAGAASLVWAAAGAELVIVDTTAESLVAQGHDEDRAAQVTAWSRLLARPMARTGSAVLLLDHVTKDREKRGRYARGSGAKINVTDGASYIITANPPFSRTERGRIKLVVSKDRPGYVGAPGTTAALVYVDPEDGGRRIHWRVEPPSGTTGEAAPPVVSPVLCEAVVEVIKARVGDEEFTQRRIADHVRARGHRFSDAALGPAIALLEQEGRLSRRSGRRGAYVFTLPMAQQSLNGEGK